ncbi:ester cyclase [Rhodococcus jostii]|uniref:SnoaL-like polyketide cyclase n=1 Tax=Rhodococcus jostii TaxID=132919 RepID=A0A1H4ZAY7_RHOJO|nr:ester cyclase [Rhodococcus jostii]SED27055.1 conserved hypothetical protein, steroid delta-isomerase-related [Rhodococcus jostii]
MDPTTGHASTLATVWDSVWNHGRLDTLDEHLSPQYIRHGRSGDQDATAMKDSVAAVRTAFPDLHLTMHDLIEDADRVALRWQGSGTHDRMFRGVPPTGRTVTVSGTTFVRFDRSAIAEEWVIWDDSDITRSLGVIALGQHPAL